MISGEPVPSLEELRARPVGRTGAELVLALRHALLLVTWDENAGVFRVRDTENRQLLLLGTAGPVHSAVVFEVLAVTKRWQPPSLNSGHISYRPEQLVTGERIYAVRGNELPVAFGQGPTEADAWKDLARTREDLSAR
jgi:hypothetical protein